MAGSCLAELGYSVAPNFEGIVFGGLVVDRITVLGSADDEGLNTIDLSDAVSVVQKIRGDLDLDWIEREADLLAVELPDFGVRERYARLIDQ